LLGCLAVALGLSNQAQAQDLNWPIKPVRLVVPFAPGGGSDIKGRVLAEHLTRHFGQRFIVENRAGMAGSLGAASVAKAPPDGYSILYTTPGPQITNPFLYKELPYDSEKELAPVIFLFRIPNVLVVNPKLPVHSIKDLIGYARANPSRMNFASTGGGSSSHLAGELFKALTKVDMTHVPYRGSGPAGVALQGGEVQMTIDSIAAFHPHYSSGRLRVLGVSTLTRIPSQPEIPAIAETIPGFEASSMAYITITGGTSAPIIARLNQALNQIIRIPEVIERFAVDHVVPVGGGPEVLEQAIRGERAKWKRIIELTGTTAE
jgi:tripartite-type tricarboxylate transporter receptor subunit TctC